MTPKTEKAPELAPPAPSNAQTTTIEGEPQLGIEDVLDEAFAAPGETAPTQFPPTEAAAIEAAGDGIAAWHNGKKITALWSDQANRNSWISIQGMGWKKLAKKNDSSSLSLTMIGAHAEQTGATVNVRIESDGLVHELYAW